MDFPTLTPERAAHIDEVAESLRSQYMVDEVFDWSRALADRGIHHVQDDRFVVPCAVSFKNGQYAMGVPTRQTAIGNINAHGHELGHLVLGHLNPEPSIPKQNREDEADYFSLRLIGEEENDSIIFDIVAFLKHPRQYWLQTMGSREEDRRAKGAVFMDHLSHLFEDVA